VFRRRPNVLSRTAATGTLILATAFATGLGLRVASAQTTASSAPAHFEIDEFRVEGNTTLSDIDVDHAVEKMLGPNRTTQDVEAARAALEKAYADKGFPTVSVEIPVQHVTDGVIIVNVTERKVGRLRVTGSRYFALDDVRNGAGSVAEGRVPNVKQLERDIVALNQQADRSVTPVLKAGVAPDTVDVDLQVTDTLPLHGSLEVNNSYSQSTKPLRALATLSYDNLWQRGDSATIAYQIAPQRPSDVDVVSGSYLFHIPGSDMSLLGSYVHSDSNVTTVGSTNVVGRGDIAGVRLLIPLGTDPHFTHSLAIGADYKKVTQDTAVGGTTSTAPLTYYPFTASYQATWISSSQDQTNLIASVTSTFRGLGSSQPEFDNKRAFAEPNFIYLHADLTHLHELPYGMQIFGHVSAQLSAEPLISNEQFSLGGLYTVRGYLESEALGDYGAALQVELRSPDLAAHIDERINELRLFAFGDVGAAGIENALLEQTSSSFLSSAGVGMRIRLFDYLYAEVADATTFSRGPATAAGTNRVLFRAYGEF
jgi:hemolysin activation/secretion protein